MSSSKFDFLQDFVKDVADPPSNEPKQAKQAKKAAMNTSSEKKKSSAKAPKSEPDVEPSRVSAREKKPSSKALSMPEAENVDALIAMEEKDMKSTAKRKAAAVEDQNKIDAHVQKRNTTSDMESDEKEETDKSQQKIEGTAEHNNVSAVPAVSTFGYGRADIEEEDYD